jgi:hypothetical protein
LGSWVNPTKPATLSTIEYSGSPMFIRLFVWFISHQPTVLFCQNKSATNNQTVVLFSQNKSAPATSQTNRPIDSILLPWSKSLDAKLIRNKFQKQLIDVVSD